MRTCNTRIRNCAARTANIRVEFGSARSGYTKEQQVHGGGAGKQEIHTGLWVGNASKKNVHVYLPSLRMKVPDHVYVFGSLLLQ
jgi:hypothetical protein